jgi:hypothetical protein
MAEPGGQRVDALGGMAVVLLGAWLGVGAASASADPALNNNAKDKGYICLMVVHRFLRSHHPASATLDCRRCAFRALFHSSICIGDAMLMGESP